MTQEVKKWLEQLDEDEQMTFEERAAIMQYHGNMPQKQAELLAFERQYSQMIHQELRRLSHE